MKSIQHVLWRGALALSLMAVGLGTGLGMPPAEQASAPNDCPGPSHVLVADELPQADAHASGTPFIVLRRPLNPAG